jgi:hypothetical protein
MTAAARTHRTTGTRCAQVAALGLVCLVLSAMIADRAGATTTFGADLSQPPDLSFHCNVPPPFFGPYRPPSPHAFPDTCTAFTAGNFGGGGAGSHLVPNGSGVITKIRISEPPASFDSAQESTFGPAGPLGQSGLLKLSVLQALRQGQSSVAVCCTVPLESTPFNVVMGAITEVTFTPPIPVHAIVTSTGVYEFDAIAITALEASSVIPAGRSSTASSGGYYPAVQQGQERNEQETSFGSADTVNSGTQIMMQADWEPVAEPGGGTPTPGSPTPAPPTANPVPLLPTPLAPTLGPKIPVPVQIVGNNAARVLGNDAVLNLACVLTATPCVGLVQLQNLPAQASRKSRGRRGKHQTIVYASGTFNIPAGREGHARVRLQRAGKQLLKHQRSATVWATFKTYGATATTLPPVRLKLTH